MSSVGGRVVAGEEGEGEEGVMHHMPAGDHSATQISKADEVSSALRHEL
jgi:hypothetical protein